MSSHLRTVVTYQYSGVSNGYACQAEISLCETHDTPEMREKHCYGVTDPSVSYGRHRGVCDIHLLEQQARDAKTREALTADAAVQGLGAEVRRIEESPEYRAGGLDAIRRRTTVVMERQDRIRELIASIEVAS